MIEHKKYKISDELISKFLYGELSKQEADYILDAIQDDEERKHLLQQKNILDEIHLQKVAEEIDTEKSLSKLLEQVDLSISSANEITKPNKFISNFLKVAAAIILLISIGVTGYYLNKPEEIMLSAETETIKDVVLPDSSKINLNKGTKLLFPEKFGKKQREVTLLSGEAYFEVKNTEDKPFIIKTPQGRVQVLGTEFNVLLDTLGGNTEVFVEKGRVKVEFLNDKGEYLPAVILETGKKCSYSHVNQVLDTISTPDLNSLVWKTGLFVFEEASVVDALETIAKEYEYNISIESPSLESCKITATMNKTGLATILQAINLTTNIETRIDNETIFVSGEGCDPINE